MGAARRRPTPNSRPLLYTTEMADRPISRTIEELGPDTPFAFYPPIVNIDHNEWRYLDGVWSEVQVRNDIAEIEIWIPRVYFGEISATDKPLAIVGLKRELEYKAGSVWPYQRRVLSMPAPRVDGASAAYPVEKPSTSPATPSSERRLGGLILIGLAIAILLGVALVAWQTREPRYAAIMQVQPHLTAQDDYFAVVRTLGPPASERWASETGAVQFRLLYYPSRSMIAVLMGRSRAEAFYIGIIDPAGHPLHSVTLAAQEDSSALLRSIRP